mgnify:CR=1 FL=1
MNKVAADLTIGAFARRSRLSLKALRLYDAVGLLPPTYVDPDSGYRYYAEAQLKRAQLIVLLRRIDMPLNTIAEIIEAGEKEAVKVLNDYWSEVETEVRENRRVVEYLHDYLLGKEPTMAFEIKVREIPAQKVLSLSKEIYVKDLPPFIGSTIGKLTGRITAQGAQVSGAPEAIYHGQVDEDNNGPVEIVVPFAGEVVPAESITLKEHPARQEAYTTLTLEQLEFPDILKAYDAVRAWLEGNGKKMAGSPREVYFSSAEKPIPDKPFCDIAWPFNE